MSTQVKRRRGTTTEHTTFTGAVGEITVDTDRKTAVVHDGARAGGFPLQHRFAVSPEQFGAVGDGVTDDYVALRAAFSAAKQGTLVLPSANYFSGQPIYSPHAVHVEGRGTAATKITFEVGSANDGLVLGWRNHAAYADEAAFLSALPGLDDGWYLIGSSDLRFVDGGVQVATDTRDVTDENRSNQGYSLCNLLVRGASTSEMRDAIVADNLWKFDADNVWARDAGGRGFVISQVLHCSTRGLRSDNTVSHGVDLTGGDTTSTVMIGGYHRATHTGAGIKSDCIGTNLIGPICEGIGGSGGADVYAPGIWITGGSVTINEPYFEDVRGHNIFANDGKVTINGGQNGSGAGANTARYAAICICGTAKANINNGGYAPGGSNKQDIFVERDTGGTDVYLTGAGAADHQVMAVEITDPTNYTECDYDVADVTALNALTGMTSGQTAHVRSDTAGSCRDYTYDGADWIKISSHDFPGSYTRRNAADGDWRAFGNRLAIRAGASLTAVDFMRSVTFDAGASADNVAGMQSGAAVAAHTTVTATKALGFTIPGYSGSTSKNYMATFNTPLLSNGILCRVNILGATSVQIVIHNATAGSVNLNSDVRGQIVIERFSQDTD